MSNDLTVFLQNNTALIGTGLDADTLAVAGSGNANKRISIKASVFRKIAGGKEVGQITDREMNIIFVKMAHDPSRQFYPDAYVEGSKLAPMCWSNDAKTPDPEVIAPQAASCDKCPQSIKGTGRDGKGTACRLAWRTAVVLPSDPQGDVMQLVLPAMSCFGDEMSGRWPFRAYVQMLANHNISAGRVITKMSFDTSASAPRVLFSPVSAVPPDDLPALASQSKSHAAEQAIKLTVFKADQIAEEPAAPAEPAPVKAPEPIHMPVEPSKIAPKKAEGFTPVAGTGEAPRLQVDPSATKTETDVSDIVKKWSKKKTAQA